jgi:hypothetical protein
LDQCFSSNSLSRRRFANLGAQINDVAIGFAHELTLANLRPNGVLQQFGGREPALLDQFVEVIR